uniref:Fibronectin type-III domain-containing protein 3A n=1 Tax=Sinocyclocheilus anshuiensis TaxID=1608454 RepID=A0A671MLA4_9TELE
SISRQLLSNFKSPLLSHVPHLSCFLQVILVQVNPGEAFTIQRDDGQFQCITGPAQVPMMSPNGSVPQIYVPPGYVQQIIEENGVRRVLVLPQTEFHPGGHSPLHHPPPPPPHATHTHTHFCFTKSEDRMLCHYTHPPHGRAAFAHRDERASKTYERLQKKLKERHGVGGGGGGGLALSKDSPPPSPQKSRGTPPSGGDLQNGLGGKGADEQAQPSTAVTSLGKSPGRGKDTESGGRIYIRGEEGPAEPSFTYEVSVSHSGKDGKFKIYVLCVFRVQAMCNCLQGVPSEPVSFTTLSCEPDGPSPPRKTSGTKSSLVLQWKAPCDNGSKIQNYILQWDEGKGTGAFEQCYYGPQKQYRLTKLSTASRYYFRLAAKNDMGVSEFSDVVHIMTSCSVPAPPLSPELIQSGVTWLCVRWHRPAGSPKEDEISYVLEMEEEGSGYGFQASYDGDELSHTVRNLHRSTTYRFRVIAYNAEGKSNPSGVSEFTTAPDRPGCPCRLTMKGKPHPTSFRLTWGQFSIMLTWLWSAVTVSAGAYTLFSLRRWNVVCTIKVYQDFLVQTPPVPPGPCQPPRVVGKPKAREVQLRWAPPLVDGGSAVSSYSVEMFAPQVDEGWEVYQGSELDCTVGSLLPGRTYGFRLRAANKAGYGPFSERSEVTTGPGAPEVCRPPHVTCKSPTCAVISWEAPPCNGAAVSEYRLEWGAAEGSMQMCYTGAALSHEMKGLLPATNYFCRVQAVNVAGVGPFSDAVLCQTPCSVPAPVSKRGEDEEDEEARPLLYSSSTCLGLRWEAPCDHGSEIMSYLIDLGERQPILTGPVTKYIIQNLHPDTTYRIRIQALNSLGAGPFSHTFKLKTKPLPPLPPRLECTASSHQTLRLKWGDGPAKAQPTDSLQYHLQMEDKNGRFISLYKGPCHTHKVQRLNESTSYAFRIQAFNEAGEGPFSTVYTFTTPRSPPAPLKAPRVERVDESCEVSWETLPPMKGDPVIYCLQSMQGNSEFKQIYKGSATSYQLPNLSSSTEYRFRVCAIRQCQDAPEIIGPYSSTVIMLPPRVDTPGVSGTTGSKAAEAQKPKRSLTDEQFSFLIIALLAVTSILIAVAIQYFVIE